MFVPLCWRTSYAKACFELYGVLGVRGRLRRSGGVWGGSAAPRFSFFPLVVAAARLAELPVWRQARVVKANPDAAQAPVRLRALSDGKILYMAVPRLTDARCFVELIADDLTRRGIDLASAARWQGALEHGRLV